jgi:aminoacylase
LPQDPSKKLGDVTTVNLTMLSGGVQYNVVPAEVEAGFDMRIPPHVDLQELKRTVDEWTKEEGVEYDFKQVYWDNPVTDISEKNLFWTAFTKACDRW